MTTQAIASNDQADLDGVLAGLLIGTPQTIEISEGDVLCAAGDPADDWWYVETGWADVTLDGLLLGSVGAGETIGEIAVLDGRPRTASVTARTPMRLHVGSASQLVAALESSATIATAMVRLLALRIRDERVGIVTVTSRTPAPSGPPATPPARVTFDPLAPGYFDDPFPQLSVIREQDAVHVDPATGHYLLLRYEHVHALARDRRLGREITHAAPNPSIDAEREMFASRPRAALSMLRVDGDDHDRVRRLVQPVFTPKVVAQWRQRAIDVTEEMLDRIASRGGGDLITDYALHLPVRIVSDMLGLPTDRVPELRDWSHAITKTLDPICTEQERADAMSARASVSDFIDTVCHEKRQSPEDDLLSALVHAEDHGDRLTHVELLANVLALFIAGHETTTNLIAATTIALLNDPDQLVQARCRPELDANLVEEGLRFTTPVQFNRRISKQPIVVGDVEIPEGSVVQLCAAAANRDPRKWGADADRFMLDRKAANEHVSFGGGAHFCIGAALARLEASQAIPRLVRRFPKLAIIDPPVFESRLALRSIRRLAIEV